jgi:hypothetical protein
MYDNTMSKDGNRRVSFKMDLRMDFNDMATMIVADDSDLWSYDADAGTKVANHDAIAKLTSRRAIIKKVQEAVLFNGTDTPHYRIGDNDLHGVVDAVEAQIATIWGRG